MYDLKRWSSKHDDSYVMHGKMVRYESFRDLFSIVRLTVKPQSP